MRKPVVFTLICLLFAFGTNETRTQTGSHVNRRQSIVAFAAPPPAHLVVDATEENLIGGFRGKTWLDLAKSFPFVKAGETYRLYTLAGPAGTGVVSEVSKGPPEEPCEDLVNVTISPLPEDDREIIGVNGSWNAQPRLPKIQDTDQQEYRNVVGRFLSGIGIAGPKIVILQIIRVDLEGDGTEEVLISANSKAEPSGFMLKGDFSVMLLRKLVGGKVRDIPVASEVEKRNVKDPDLATGLWHHKHTVAAILDINGDGLMEIIISERSFRDSGKAVIEIKGGKPKQVLGWYCSGGH